MRAALVAHALAALPVFSDRRVLATVKHYYRLGDFDEVSELLCLLRAQNAPLAIKVEVAIRNHRRGVVLASCDLIGSDAVWVGGGES